MNRLGEVSLCLGDGFSLAVGSGNFRATRPVTTFLGGLDDGCEFTFHARKLVNGIVIRKRLLCHPLMFKRLQYRKSLSCQAEEQRVFSTTGTVLASVRTSSRTVPLPGSGMSTVTNP